MPNSDPRPNGEKPTGDSSTPKSPQASNQNAKRAITAGEEIEAFDSSPSSLREDNAFRSTKRVKLSSDIMEPLDKPIDQYPSTTIPTADNDKDSARNKFDGDQGKRDRKSGEEDNDDPSVKRAKHKSTDTPSREALPIRTQPFTSVSIRRKSNNRPLEQQLAGLRLFTDIPSIIEEQKEDNASVREASPVDKTPTIKVEDYVAGEVLFNLEQVPFYNQMQEVSLNAPAPVDTNAETSQADSEEPSPIKQEESDSAIDWDSIPEFPGVVNPPLPLSWGTGAPASTDTSVSMEDLLRGLNLSFLDTDNPDRFC
ncbi:hypothetical protein BJ875DRAFT_488678 [Amylocarpus encephaloides]|uniref:Uncharacterized protein n=1 Tax=Amylocarpus encephaloides TaxID=45428 RepID=A0A9P7YAV6_9HELO|nr:hypothetical protein BJ875DRAFT_488678 [Amylocarpus encephaloides]